MQYDIMPERAEDLPLIDPLLDRTFGFDRWQRTVYRLREGVDPIPGLCLSAVDRDGALLGSIRYWPIMIGDKPAILLGPLAVEPALQGQGIGKMLVHESLAKARQYSHGICVVVGEPGYYRPFGFFSAAQAGLILPGPVDPQRFQVAELLDGALENVSGLIGRCENAPTGLHGASRRA